MRGRLRRVLAFTFLVPAAVALLAFGVPYTGASQDVCPATPTLVYSERDATAGAYAAPVTARCDAGGEIEL